MIPVGVSAKAYLKGREDRRNGVARSDCPFPATATDSSLADLWRESWDDEDASL